MKLSMAVRTIAGVAGTCIALGVIVVTAQDQPSMAATVHHHHWTTERVVRHTLRYSPDQLTCKRSQRGMLAIVTGDGPHGFIVKCARDGHSSGKRAYVWDAQ